MTAIITANKQEEIPRCNLCNEPMVYLGHTEFGRAIYGCDNTVEGKNMPCDGQLVRDVLRKRIREAQ